MKPIAAALLCAVPLAAQQFRPERYAPIPPVVAGWPVQEIATGDVDGDGFDDVFVALDYGGVAYLRADRHGGFVDDTARLPQVASPAAYGVSLGDADNDGDLDLVSVHDHSGVVQVCMNQGGGTFVDVTATFSPVLASWPVAVTWIDIDGDRLLDVFVSEYAGNRVLHQQNGRLVDVSATHLPAGLRRMSYRVRAIDVDADGDQDLLGPRGAVPMLLNDGAGRFTVAPAGLFPASSWQLYGFGDFDGDRLVDLLVASGRNALWFQAAGGSFVDRTATHFAGISSVRDAFAADVDLDGDLDLCRFGDLLVNDGVGRFSIATQWWTPVIPFGGYTVAAAAFGDVDGDGDPDFVVVDRQSSQLVSFNHTRHVSTPTAPVRGGTYTIVYEVSPGFATSSSTVLPWFGFRPYSLRLPGFGHLGIDPAAVITGPPIAVPAPVGRATLQLGVPGDLALSGVTLYLQAVPVNGPSALRLTNTVADRIQ